MSLTILLVLAPLAIWIVLVLFGTACGDGSDISCGDGDGGGD